MKVDFGGTLFLVCLWCLFWVEHIFVRVSCVNAVTTLSSLDSQSVCAGSAYQLAEHRWPCHMDVDLGDP